MIALLQTIAAARDQAPQILGRRPAALLEWPRVTAQLAAFCLNRRAAAAIRRRRPYADPQPIALDHALADELRALEAGDRDLPVVQVGQALALLERPAPIRLEGPDLVHIAAIAEELDALRGYLLDRRDRCPRWAEAAVQAATFGGLCGAVRRALDTDGRILRRGERPAGQAAALGDRPGTGRAAGGDRRHGSGPRPGLDHRPGSRPARGPVLPALAVGGQRQGAAASCTTAPPPAPRFSSSPPGWSPWPTPWRRPG